MGKILCLVYCNLNVHIQVSIYFHLLFQVMEPYYPFTNSTVEDLTIGEENCEGKAAGYCNGALKSGTTYRVKIRAFTTPDKFTDTYYSFPIQTGIYFSASLP